MSGKIRLYAVLVLKKDSSTQYLGEYRIDLFFFAAHLMFIIPYIYGISICNTATRQGVVAQKEFYGWITGYHKRSKVVVLSFRMVMLVH